MKFKIGFPHSHPQYKKQGVIIVNGCEMPHWGKKFCNAFDNKSRNLTFYGRKMNLQMLNEDWQAGGDAETSVGLVMRYKFTHNHFNFHL